MVCSRTSFGLFPIDDEMQDPVNAEFFPIRHNTPIKKTQLHSSPSPCPFFFVPLNRSLVRQRSERLRRVVSQRDCAGVTGLSGLTLDLDGGAGGGGILLLLGVLLDSAQEVVSAAGGLDVLDLDVDALLDVATPDLLVDNDTDGALGDVVDNASLAVVDLVGHTNERVSTPCHLISNFLSSNWKSYPFWTAPFTLMSTMSPTLFNMLAVIARPRRSRGILTGTGEGRC